MNEATHPFNDSPSEFAKTMTESEILGIIERQQTIQKRNPPDSYPWQLASEIMAPLFTEMARRQSA